MLAVACLGVLKYNRLDGKSDRARERPATGSFLPIIETKQGPNSMPAEGIAKARRVDRWMAANPPNSDSNPYSSRSEGSNQTNSAAMDHVKSRR